MGKSLKAQNTRYVVAFLILHIAFYTVFYTGYTNFWEGFFAMFKSFKVKNSVVFAIAPLLAFILSGIISPHYKGVIVFWKLKYPLPGSRVFSTYATCDYRIDMDVLKGKIGQIPVEPVQQNKMWYKIFKQVENIKSVNSAHKNFLLARDITTISFIFLITTPVTIYFRTTDINVSLLYAFILLIEYIVLCIVAQNAGKRFVCNVLAEYCCR